MTLTERYDPQVRAGNQLSRISAALIKTGMDRMKAWRRACAENPGLVRAAGLAGASAIEDPSEVLEPKDPIDPEQDVDDEEDEEEEFKPDYTILPDPDQEPDEDEEKKAMAIRTEIEREIRQLANACQSQQRGLSFAQAYSRVLLENPGLYDQYLKERDLQMLQQRIGRGGLASLLSA